MGRAPEASGVAWLTCGLSYAVNVSFKHVIEEQSALVSHGPVKETRQTENARLRSSIGVFRPHVVPRRLLGQVRIRALGLEREVASACGIDTQGEPAAVRPGGEIGSHEP